MKQRISRKAAQFTESVIREMTRLAMKHDAINLAQGFPNFASPQWLKDAACDAIQANINQYAVTWGAPGFRNAIARKYKDHYDFDVDVQTEITVACGATECMIAALLAILDPGDQVLIMEPFYENYGPDCVIAGAQPIFFPLEPRTWTLDADSLRATLEAHRPRGPIKAMILNTPNNPSGRVFNRKELETISALASEFDFYVITDEIYEHIVYDAQTHHLIASFPEMRDRTITISGLSKTFSVTGWRLGYLIAPPDVTSAIRKMHDFLTVGAAAPLQEAAAIAMAAEAGYYQTLAKDYRQRRDFFVPALAEIGFFVTQPEGAYYVMAETSGLTGLDDVALVRKMIREVGVAAVPGTSFYHRPELGRQQIRFAFCKTLDLLESAIERLQKLPEALA